MWQCTKCHSKIEDSFDVCWNCGTTKDGVEDPDFQPADTGDKPTTGGVDEVDLSAVLTKSAPSADAQHATATGHLLARLLVLVLRVLAMVIAVWGVFILIEMAATGNRAASREQDKQVAQAVTTAQTNVLFMAALLLITVVTVILALAEALRIFIKIEANTRGAQTPHLRERGNRRHQ